MKRNQLFKITPDNKIIQFLLDSFGLEDLEDTRPFTKEYMKEIKTVETIQNNKERINKYYLPCKAKVYLYGINEKKAITILRQFIKVYNYSLYSIEKSNNGIRQTHYSLMYINKDCLSPIKNKENEKIVIHFDM